MGEIKNENKIEKSTRNNKLFFDMVQNALKANSTIDLDEARENGTLVGTNNRLPLLKVKEVFSIRKEFDLETAEDKYILYKEKYYVENPGSNYAETVSQNVYRKVVRQHENGNADWAKRISDKLGIKIVEE